MADSEKSRGAPWPVWAIVTLLAAIVPAYIAISPGKNDSVKEDDLKARYEPDVKAVVQRSMAIGTHAYLNNDPNLLSQVFKGEALKTIVAEIERFQAAGTRLNREVSSPVFQSINFTKDPLRAQVRISRVMEGKLELVSTGECKEAIPRFTQEQTYYLEISDATWLISSVIAHTPSPVTVSCAKSQ